MRGAARSGALQTRDLAPHALYTKKIPDQRRGIVRRIASGMTAYGRTPLPFTGEGGALAPGERKSSFAKRAAKPIAKEPSPPAPLPQAGEGRSAQPVRHSGAARMRGTRNPFQRVWDHGLRVRCRASPRSDSHGRPLSRYWKGKWSVYRGRTSNRLILRSRARAKARNFQRGRVRGRAASRRMETLRPSRPLLRKGASG